MTSPRFDAPAPATGSGDAPTTDKGSRRWAGIIGVCLPLSGGFALSQWVPGYPDQINVIRLVTLGALLWILLTGGPTRLAPEARQMIRALGVVLAYAFLSLTWTPDKIIGLHDFFTTGLALATGVVLLILVSRDSGALTYFAGGLLVAGAAQVGLSVVEVTRGIHLQSGFGADEIATWNLPRIEVLTGPVAWGSLGNPNDLGGFLLFVLAVYFAKSAYGLQLRPWQSMVGYAVTATAVWVAWTSLEDARAFRLGLVIVVAMHLADRIWPPGRSAFRVPGILILLWLLVAFVATNGPRYVSGESDSLRFALVSDAFKSAYVSGGFGRGLGAENAMLDSGEIPINLHNIVATLANDLGYVVAAVFLVYLLGLIVSWVFVTRSASRLGGGAALARATLASSLLFYGATSSGVLESPTFWTFFVVTAAFCRPPQSTETRVERQAPMSDQTG